LFRGSKRKAHTAHTVGHTPLPTHKRGRSLCGRTCPEQSPSEQSEPKEETRLSAARDRQALLRAAHETMTDPIPSLCPGKPHSTQAATWVTGSSALPQYASSTGPKPESQKASDCHRDSRPGILEIIDCLSDILVKIWPPERVIVGMVRLYRPPVRTRAPACTSVASGRGAHAQERMCCRIRDDVSLILTTFGNRARASPSVKF